MGLANKIALIFRLTITLSILLLSSNTVTAEAEQNVISITFDCPQNQAYDNETQSCQETNSRAPCGGLMVFVEDEENEKFGKCECDEDEGGDPNNTCTYRPVIYWPEHKRCYFAYEQGPCSPGEWLIVKQSAGVYDRAICSENPCPRVPSDLNLKSQFWFPFGGNCYMTGTQGFCRDPQYSVYIMKNGLTPLCLPESSCHQEGGGNGTRTEPCSRSRRYVGKCRRKLTFSFPTNFEHVVEYESEPNKTAS